MRVLICGSRLKGASEKQLLEAHDVVYSVLDELPDDIVIIHGGALGVDSIVHSYCSSYDMKEIVVKPKYDKYGKTAPIIRNREMLDMEPDKVLAFWDGRSKGTKSVIDEAKHRKISIDMYLIGDPDEFR